MDGNDLEVLPIARSYQGGFMAKIIESVVRGTQESDRVAALASAEIEVRAGAVLPGSGSPSPPS
jgi:hypothetical protein